MSPVETEEDSVGSDLSPSTLKWILGIELGLSGLAASEPSHFPVSDSKVESSRSTHVPWLHLGTPLGHFIPLITSKKLNLKIQY